MRDSRYQVFAADLNFYQEMVSCQAACPVRTDARGYVTAISRGEYERAYLIARETNPFASTCGWVCGAPCEAACRRGRIDEPIAIRALKRFVNDRYGVFMDGAHRADGDTRGGTYSGPAPEIELGNTAVATSRQALRGRSASVSASGRRVAVVGSGPAGLSCAHDLGLLGHEVIVFESTQVAGGMLRLGVPEYRLSRALIDLEIEAVLSLGPRIEFGRALGRDFDLADLRRNFDAVFLGIGTYTSRRLNIEGETLDGVLRAVDFLINVNLGGYNLDLGRNVLVIGGGNVAMDVARTAARLGRPAQSGGDLDTAIDAARSAQRLGATEEVHCLVVEARNEMLADPIEMAEAEEEGIQIHNHAAPVRFIGQGGQLRGVVTMDVERAFDESGRFNPQLVPGSERIWQCDGAIVSIGQTGDLSWVREEDGLEVTPRGSLAVDADTLETSSPGIFAGGDIAFGPRLIINAVADGQTAARSIHTYLGGTRPRLARSGFFSPIPAYRRSQMGPQKGYLERRRMEPPTIPIDRRVGVSLVEESYDPSTAHEQASRCLVCSVSPIFDGSLCIMCSGCVDVCPFDCLKLVPVREIDGDDTVRTVLERYARVGGSASAMLYDPTLCIRCGLCAERCPTGAVQMEAFRFTEELESSPGEPWPGTPSPEPVGPQPVAPNT
ncbi:MAG: FAD-dependent oxidoreductase [Thermoleophilia bacterium]|nr:FAD-dependent oxidoreductase [Thermoleophilia bacterium]